MVSERILLAVVACGLLGCAGVRPREIADDAVEATTATVEPAPAHCELRRLSVELRFFCCDAQLHLELHENREAFSAFVDMIRTRPGLRGVVLRGTISWSAYAERDRPEFAVQRARSVADALVREGIPRAMIEALAEPGPDTVAASEQDPCPAAEDDEYGDRRRAVLLGMNICAP